MHLSLRNKVPGPLIVWTVAYVFFLLTLVNNFSAAHDSINYLYHITRGEHLFHQHHLLYHFLANKWLIFFQQFFNCAGGMEDRISSGLLVCRDHYLIESFTAVWGASVLTLVYLFFRNRFLLTRAACFAGTAVVAFSYGTWFYSTNIEVYMPPIFFILWSLYILTQKTVGSRDIVMVAVLHSLAILFHQVNVLFAVVVLFSIIRHRLYRSLPAYVLIGVVLTGLTYFLAGWFAEGKDSFPEWIAWMQGYTSGHGFWQPLSLKTPLHVLTGFSHAFIGGHFVFQIPFVRARLESSFQSHGLTDEAFLSANISSTGAILLMMLALVFAVVFVYLLINFILRLRTLASGYSVVWPLLLCIGVYSLFFCFWMPEILEFWILQMILTWMLLLGTVKKQKMFFLLPLLLFCLNYFGSMRWLQSFQNDWYYMQIIDPEMEPSAREGDWIMEDYRRFFQPEVPPR